LGKHRYEIDGRPYEVDVVVSSGEEVEVHVNGTRLRVRRAPAGPETAEPPAAVVRAPSHASAGKSRRATAPSAGELRAPMAGLVLRVEVSEGQRVAAGAAMLVLDAMKMENTLRAPHAGVVRALEVGAGDTVLTGALLARLEPA
jgi:biotin carboxyl carrier protein